MSDARTVLRIVEEGREFDFVICDMKMPEIRGDDFYRAIEKKKPSMKGRIIFCTGDLSSDRVNAFIESTKNPAFVNPLTLTSQKDAVIGLTKKKWGHRGCSKTLEWD